MWNNFPPAFYLLGGGSNLVLTSWWAACVHAMTDCANSGQQANSGAQDFEDLK
jgi:hypothetical protein